LPGGGGGKKDSKGTAEWLSDGKRKGGGKWGISLDREGEKGAARLEEQAPLTLKKKKKGNMRLGLASKEEEVLCRKKKRGVASRGTSFEGGYRLNLGREGGGGKLAHNKKKG